MPHMKQSKNTSERLTIPWKINLAFYKAYYAEQAFKIETHP